MVTTRVRPTVTTEQVWRQLTKSSFAVVGHITPAGDPRSSGVMYVVADRRLYAVVAPDSWKASHLAADGRVAVTVPVRRGRLASLIPVERRASGSVVEIEPVGDFVLYGIGVPLPRMREPDAARARVPVAGR